MGSTQAIPPSTTRIPPDVKGGKSRLASPCKPRLYALGTALFPRIRGRRDPSGPRPYWTLVPPHAPDRTPSTSAPRSASSRTTQPPSVQSASALSRLMHNAVRRVCPSWMGSHREDIGQAALLQILNRKRRCGHMELTPAYVRRVARNAVIDAIRAHTRHEALVRMHHSRARTYTRGPDGGDQLLVKTLADQFCQLGGQRREAVLCYLAGERIQEIAARLGWSQKRASNTVFRSLIRLRRELARRGVVPQSEWL